jgi:LAO/AO transport system kinase
MVLKTSALTGEGIGEFVESIEKHRAYLRKGALDHQRRATAEIELIEALKQKIAQTIIQDLRQRGEWVTATEKITAREIDPYSAADALLKRKLTRS